MTPTSGRMAPKCLLELGGRRHAECRRKADACGGRDLQTLAEPEAAQPQLRGMQREQLGNRRAPSARPNLYRRRIGRRRCDVSAGLHRLQQLRARSPFYGRADWHRGCELPSGCPASDASSARAPTFRKSSRGPWAPPASPRRKKTWLTKSHTSLTRPFQLPLALSTFHFGLRT